MTDGLAAAEAEWLWANEPCRAACPVHTDAGAYVTAIAAGRFREAYLIARRPNPFASICGRVCAAPCEAACRRGTIDAPVSIRALKRFVSERFGVESFATAAVWHEGHGEVPPPTEGSVAIIGGGPAGLAAAYELRLAGHGVTIYEASRQLGGMMVHGIPAYRLPRELITREVDAILELGIETRFGVTIGTDITVGALLDKHAAVFLAIGTGTGRDLALPGHDQDGIVRAIEFLLNVNQGFRVELGKRVVIVGGGNVAFDAARTALRAPTDVSGDARRSMTTTLDAARSAIRAGVESVTIVALESPRDIPAEPGEIAEAEAEGIVIEYGRGPRRFVGDGTRVTALETSAVESLFDADGRFAPTFVPESDELLPADTVILAVGQAADLSLLRDIEVERTPNGVVRTDPVSLRTSHPRIWAGGDVAHGPRNLIDAIADGRRAASAIHTTITNSAPPATRGVRVELQRRPSFRRIASSYDAIARVEIPSLAVDRRVGFNEVESGYSEREARLEGLRCLRCFDNVMLDPSLCILCGLCVDVCPTDCITIEPADRHGHGIAAQSVLLLEEDNCIRCGLCVNRCPPNALSMVLAREVGRV